MKTVFALNDQNYLALDFTKSKMLGIYDEIMKDIKFIEFHYEDAINDKQSVFNQILQQGITKVVSPHYSFMSLRVFKENNIEPLKAVGKSLAFNLNMLIHKQLQVFCVDESGNETSCAKSCAGCSVGCK